MGVIPALGTGGTALALTAVLWFGTSQGGKVKQLPWGWCLLLALVAGAAYKAAGDPIGLSPLVGEAVNLLNGIVPGVTVAALGVIMLAIILWKKLSLRGVSMCGIFFFFVMAATTGTFGKVSSVLANVASRLAGA